MDNSILSQSLIRQPELHRESDSFQKNACAESDCHTLCCHHLSTLDPLLLIEYDWYVDQFNLNQVRIPSHPFLERHRRPPIAILTKN